MRQLYYTRIAYCCVEVAVDDASGVAGASGAGAGASGVDEAVGVVDEASVTVAGVDSGASEDGEAGATGAASHAPTVFAKSPLSPIRTQYTVPFGDFISIESTTTFFATNVSTAHSLTPFMAVLIRPMSVA